MATVDQIYNVVNDIRNQAFGSKAVTVVDTSTLVSLGDYVMNSSENRDIWWSTIVDKIGRTYTAIRPYEGGFRGVRKTPLEWSTIIEKISFTINDAVENPSWTTTTADPFNTGGSVTPSTKLFKSINTWERDQFVPDYQLKKSFTSAESMGAFIGGLFIALDNALELEIERTSAMALNTYMAGVFDNANTNTNTRRNLLHEYNTLTNETLTVNTALINKDFLLWASKEINLTLKKLKKYSTLYNVEKFQRHTREEDLVVEMLADFASATTSYLEASTYHDELVKYKNYEEVPYWQGSGEQDTFADVSSINITHGNNTVNKSGIICFVHDIDAVACCDYRVKTLSIYNPKKEMTNYFKKADIGYMVDLSENGVVFYLEEV